MGHNIESYWAHRREDPDEIQTLKDHLENVAKLCGGFAGKFGMQDWGFCEGMLHDIGKYSEAFQRRIRGSEERVDHATAGAQLCWSLTGLYQFLSYCIAGHHAGLPNTGSVSDTGDRSSLYGRLAKHVPAYDSYKSEISIPKLSIPSLQPGSFEEPGFFFSFLIRMLFSCLVDADYLDTERFMQGGQTIRTGGDPIRILYERLENYTAKWKQNTDPSSINGRRTEILLNCQSNGRDAQGLFRLTVPTGGGKTIASLAFALEHALTHHLERIIFVIPYTSIIEQNAAVFAEILGRKNVLEDHCNVDYESSEELKPMQLAAENWDKPVIVTTNVQFFESLYSNKTSKCRKLHNIANSVIIFDAYEIIGLNQKSLINQGLDWLRPIFLTQKEAMKMSIRRFYEQRRKSAA